MDKSGKPLVGNILFLMALSIKNQLFNPEFPLILLTDSSYIDQSSFCCQWDPHHLQLAIIRSQRRQSPIHKEADGVHRVIDLGKPYLLQTLSPHNYLLTDAQSISYISRAKYFDNFLMEISITISEYPSLHVIHTPGRCLSLTDMMSR